MADIRSEREQLSALETLFGQKKFSDALISAGKLKDQFPDSFQIRFLHARILEELNLNEEAENLLTELMQKFPNNIKLLQEMGRVSTGRNKFNQALDYYNKILFLDPFNSEAKAAIDKIEIIRENGPGKEPPVAASLSRPGEKLHRADTLPEFGPAKTLNPPPSPSPTPEPPPPQIPEVEEEDGEFEFHAGEIGAKPFQPTELPEPPEPPELHEPFEMHEAPEPQELPEMYESLEPPIPGVEETEIGESLFDSDDFKGKEQWTRPVTRPPVPGFEETGTPEPPEMYETHEAQEPEPQEPEPVDTAAYSDTLSSFVTESAAELYLKQGLIDEALSIYKKLYHSRKEERFSVKINQLKKHRVARGKILVLSEFLRLIKQKQTQ